MMMMMMMMVVVVVVVVLTGLVENPCQLKKLGRSM
jgi:hypothetical protein